MFLNNNKAYTYVLSRAVNQILTCSIFHPAQPTAKPIGCWVQRPVGSVMPSQTIHIPEELYQYVLMTKGDNQSTSARATELMQKGKDMEDTHE